MDPGTDAPRPRNSLLAALPPDDVARLWSRFDVLDLPARHVLGLPGERITEVFFPATGAWVSLGTLLADGRFAEVGIVGTEGMVGLPLVLGVETNILAAMVQGPGTVLRLGADAFRQAMDESPALRARLLRYCLAIQSQMAQTAACNGHHGLDQRLARWLLTAHDRTQADEFTMTHEFLAMMLGVRRSGITVAAQKFRQAGLIRYGQGRIAITDRPALEAAACECYGVVRDRLQALLG